MASGLYRSKLAYLDGSFGRLLMSGIEYRHDPEWEWRGADTAKGQTRI
jgi:hypothetical protein